MTPDDVEIAFAYLGMEQKTEIAKVFGYHKRTVELWFTEGAPPHITYCIFRLIEGKLKKRGVKRYLKSIGRSRDDGNRYTARPRQEKT